MKPIAAPGGIRCFLPLLLFLATIGRQLTLSAIPVQAQERDTGKQAPPSDDPIIRELNRSARVQAIPDELNATYGRSTLFSKEWVGRVTQGHIVTDDFLDAVKEHNRALCDQVVKVAGWTPQGLVP
jgi:hypothetical protein